MIGAPDIFVDIVSPIEKHHRRTGLTLLTFVDIKRMNEANTILLTKDLKLTMIVNRCNGSLHKFSIFHSCLKYLNFFIAQKLLLPE